MAESGLPYDPPRDYAKVDKGFGARVAQAYEDMPHAPDDPAVKASYDALARETMAQWQHVKGTGLKVDWITPETGDPYADNPRAALKDIRDNNHWWGYPTDLGYGSGDEVGKVAENPMLADSGEVVSGHPARVNDIFRIVHDYFGHAKEGHGFRAEGEDNAFRSHAAMYSDAAKPAMTSELRGQNSWLNFGPHGETNRTAKAADTIYAPQKIGVMPPWSYREGMGGGMGAPLMAPQLVGHPGNRLQDPYSEPPVGRTTEWTGGRVGFADGGALDTSMLEPVDHDPFPPEPTVQPSDIARAKGFPEPRSPMHDRLEALSQDEPNPGFAQIDKMVQEHNAANPVAPAPVAPEKQVYGGELGQTAERGFQRATGAIGAAQNWAGDKLEQGVGSAAGALGVPNAPGLARDIRAMVEMPGEIGGAPRLAEEGTPRLGGAGADVAAGVEPPRAQVMDINGVKRHIDQDFPESRIGTSAPWAPAATPHANNDLNIGMHLAEEGEDQYRRNAQLLRGGLDDKGQPVKNPVPYLRIAPTATDEEAHEAGIEHMASNLEALHDAVGDDVKPGSKQWYVGAHNITRDMAVEQDIPHENAAGVVAAMSPQKDWDMNVAVARRVAHLAGNTSPEATLTPEMSAWVQRYADRKPVEKDTPNTTTRGEVLDQLQRIGGKSWANMDPTEKAFYVRAHDEAHGPPDHLVPIDDQTGQPSRWVDEKGDNKTGFYINNPDGTHSGVLARYSDEFPNKNGQPVPVSWGSNGEIENALKAYHATSMGDISEAMGQGHKVRSFYNNIIAPWSRKGDVTIDTHAVAAALLRPLGSSAPEVSQGMGQSGSKNSINGSSGLYPDVAEAYRRAADRISKRTGQELLPRELQSITWEALRGLWSPKQKSTKAVVNKANKTWQDYKDGTKTQAEAQQEILGPNGQNIQPPRWHGTWNPD